FFQAEDGIRDRNVTGVQTCALSDLLRLGPLHGDIQHLRGHCKLLIVLKGDGGSHIWIGRRSHVGMGLGGKQEQEKQGTQGRKLRSEERRGGKECTERGASRRERGRE